MFFLLLFVHVVFTWLPSFLAVYSFQMLQDIRNIEMPKDFNKKKVCLLCDFMGAHMSGVETCYVFHLLFTYVVFTQLPSTVFPRRVQAASELLVGSFFKSYRT